MSLLPNCSAAVLLLSPGTEIEDKIAANDATNTGTILFTGTGLDVECT